LKIKYIPFFFPHNAAYKTRTIGQWPVFSCDGFDERGFSRAVRSNNGNVLTYAYLQRNRIKDLSAITSNGDIPEIYQRM
jgi:hypothetical protein